MEGRPMNIEELTAEKKQLEQRLAAIDTQLDRLAVFEDDPRTAEERHQAEIEEQDRLLR